MTGARLAWTHGAGTAAGRHLRLELALGDICRTCLEELGTGNRQQRVAWTFGATVSAVIGVAIPVSTLAWVTGARLAWTHGAGATAGRQLRLELALGDICRICLEELGTGKRQQRITWTFGAAVSAIIGVAIPVSTLTWMTSARLAWTHGAGTAAG